MKTNKNLSRERINVAASTVLCDPISGDLFDSYNILLGVIKDGNGHELASDHVDVWQKLENLCVEEIIELIEANISEPVAPEFINFIDWSLLKEQKETLMFLINSDLSSKISEHLEGILALVDAVQDYVVDELGFEENKVFDME